MPSRGHCFRFARRVPLRGTALALLGRFGLSVPTVFENRRNRSGERPLLTPLDVAAGRSPDRLRLLHSKTRSLFQSTHWVGRPKKGGLKGCDGFLAPPNPAVGVGEGPAATSSGVSRGPSPTPAAGALAPIPQKMFSPQVVWLAAERSESSAAQRHTRSEVDRQRSFKPRFRQPVEPARDYVKWSKIVPRRALWGICTNER